jgi:hypothetical protein
VGHSPGGVRRAGSFLRRCYPPLIKSAGQCQEEVCRPIGMYGRGWADRAETWQNSGSGGQRVAVQWRGRSKQVRQLTRLTAADESVTPLAAWKEAAKPEVVLLVRQADTVVTRLLAAPSVSMSMMETVRDAVRECQERESVTDPTTTCHAETARKGEFGGGGGAIQYPRQENKGREVQHPAGRKNTGLGKKTSGVACLQN